MRTGINIGIPSSRKFVSSGGDVTAPTLSSAVIPAAGSTVVLTYNEALDAGSVPAAGAFSLGGTAATVASVSILGAVVTLTLSGIIGIGVAGITVSYTAGGAPIRDVAGNNAANLVAQAVTNNSTQDVTAPTLASAVINAAGTSLTLTYSEALDTGSVPALGAFSLAGTLLAALTGTPNVTGSTVVLTLAPGVVVGETGITISYTAGGAPIRDAAGNNAANLVAQAVTNNSTRARSPLDVPGLVFWGDMNDPSTYTESAGVITARTNKVTAVAITPTGSPAYQATGLNSKPTADYNGTTQYFVGTEAAVKNLGINATAKSVFMVASLNTIDRQEALVGWGDSGTSANRTVYFGQTNTTAGNMVASFRNDAGTIVSRTGTIQTDSTAHVYAFVCPGTTVASWLDNVADIASGAFDPVTLTPNRFALGSRPDSIPDTFFDGQQSEELIYNRDVTATERTYLYNYLKAKWGTP